MLERRGKKVKHKKRHRIWKEESWVLPRKRSKRRRGGPSRKRAVSATGPNPVWTSDLLFDQTEDRRLAKILVVVDAGSREFLGERVGRRLDSSHVVDLWAAFFLQRGAADQLRSDKGREFIAAAVPSWLPEKSVQRLSIEPGHPWENGFAERFFGKLGDACLNEEVFYRIEEVRAVMRSWRHSYHHERPHSALGYRPPAEAALCPVEPAACEPESQGKIKIRGGID